MADLNINDQYDFFKNVKLDENGALVVTSSEDENITKLHKYLVYNPDTDRIEHSKTMVATLSSIWLGNQHKFASGGVNTWFTNASEENHYMPAWGGLKHQEYVDNQGHEGIIKTSARVYEDYFQLEPYGAVGSTLNTTYEGESTYNINISGFGIEFVLGEDITPDIELYYSISLGGTKIYAQTIKGLTGIEGERIHWHFDQPIELREGTTITAEIMKRDADDNSIDLGILSVRLDDSGSHYYVKVFSRLFEDVELGFKDTVELLDGTSTFNHERDTTYIIDATDNVQVIDVHYDHPYNFTIRDSNKKFNVNNPIINFYDSDEVLEHTVTLNKKNKTNSFYLNNGSWYYSEEGKGNTVLINSPHISGDDFPDEVVVSSYTIAERDALVVIDIEDGTTINIVDDNGVYIKSQAYINLVWIDTVGIDIIIPSLTQSEIDSIATPLEGQTVNLVDSVEIPTSNYSNNSLSSFNTVVLTNAVLPIGATVSFSDGLPNRTFDLTMGSNGYLELSSTDLLNSEFHTGVFIGGTFDEDDLTLGIVEDEFTGFTVVYQGRGYVVASHTQAMGNYTMLNMNNVTADTMNIPSQYPLAENFITEFVEHLSYISGSWVSTGSTPLITIVNDTLTSNSSTEALSALQGKVLNDALAAQKLTVLDSVTSTDTTQAASAAAAKVAYDKGATGVANALTAQTKANANEVMIIGGVPYTNLQTYINDNWGSISYVSIHGGNYFCPANFTMTKSLYVYGNTNIIGTAESAGDPVGVSFTNVSGIIVLGTGNVNITNFKIEGTGANAVRVLSVQNNGSNYFGGCLIITSQYYGLSVSAYNSTFFKNCKIQCSKTGSGDTMSITGYGSLSFESCEIATNQTGVMFYNSSGRMNSVTFVGCDLFYGDAANTNGAGRYYYVSGSLPDRCTKLVFTSCTFEGEVTYPIYFTTDTTIEPVMFSFLNNRDVSSLAASGTTARYRACVVQAGTLYSYNWANATECPVVMSSSTSYLS